MPTQSVKDRKAAQARARADKLTASATTLRQRATDAETDAATAIAEAEWWEAAPVTAERAPAADNGTGKRRGRPRKVAEVEPAEFVAEPTA